MGRGVSSDTVKAILKKDIQRIFEIVADITSSSADLSIFFGELIEFYRDMLVIKSTKDAKAYLDLTDEEYKSTSDLAEHFTKERLLHHIKSLADAYSTMQKTASVKRVTAEMALVSLSDDRISVTPEALLSRIAALEEKLASGSFSSQSSAVNISLQEDKEKDKPISQAPKESTSLSVISSWAEVIETVERSDNFAAQMLKQSKGYTDGSKVIIKTSNAFSPTILGRSEVKALIATGINLVGDISTVKPESIEITVDQTIKNDDDPFESF
jgi:DNA polymerase-3 subunit gamma/tau